MAASWHHPRTGQGRTQAPSGGADAADAMDLMRLSSRGDSVAFAELYDTTSSRVFGLVLMITQDVASAEEVTEAVYAHVWQHSGRFDPQGGSALSWILMVAQRLAAHRITNRPAHIGTSGGPPSPPVGLFPAAPVPAVIV